MQMHASHSFIAAPVYSVHLCSVHTCARNEPEQQPRAGSAPSMLVLRAATHSKLCFASTLTTPGTQSKPTMSDRPSPRQAAGGRGGRGGGRGRGRRGGGRHEEDESQAAAALSQLSDLMQMQVTEAASQEGDNPAGPGASSYRMSQDPALGPGYFPAGGSELPSQPDLPLPHIGMADGSQGGLSGSGRGGHAGYAGLASPLAHSDADGPATANRGSKATRRVRGGRANVCRSIGRACQRRVTGQENTVPAL